METWYRVTQHSKKIEPIEVRSSTDKTLVLMNGRRTHKETVWGRYFPTYTDARNYLIGKAERNLSIMRKNMDWLEKELAEARALPEVEP